MLFERSIRRHVLDQIRPALHRLKYEHVSDDVLVEKVQSEKRMAQVIEHAHEQDQIEALREMSDLIDRHLPELYVVSQNLGGERRLGEEAGVGVATDDPSRDAARHFHRVEASAATR